MNILVTGGAGFIGSHLVDKLVENRHDVRVLDILDQQVHENFTRPKYLNKEVHWTGASDVAASAKYHLKGIDAVVHLAAQVGVGQSMYEIDKYVRHNDLATGILLDEIRKSDDHNIKKIVVASSMCLYGEGATENGRPVATTEEYPIKPTSIYGSTKRSQEELCCIFGEHYGIPTVALRLFNTYGSRQSLNNPYTGVAAIFASRYLNNQPPIIFEDGGQIRDFVHVSDVANAFVCALKEDVFHTITNVGSGDPQTVLDVALAIKEHLGSDIMPEVTHKYRAGDVRHCYADTLKAKYMLGYSAKVPFREGVKELCEWVRAESATDGVPTMLDELKKAGLVK